MARAIKLNWSGILDNYKLCRKLKVSWNNTTTITIIIIITASHIHFFLLLLRIPFINMTSVRILLQKLWSFFDEHSSAETYHHLAYKNKVTLLMLLFDFNIPANQILVADIRYLFHMIVSFKRVIYEICTLSKGLKVL